MTTRDREQRGAALVELCLIAPVLITLVLGALDLGFAWQKAMTVDHSARQGARVASSLANTDYADRAALRSVLASLDTDLAASIQSIIIYDATTDDEPPVSCLSASIANTCNRYTPAMLGGLDLETKWACSPGALDAAWCPSDRISTPLAPLTVGVYVHTEYPSLTGFFPWQDLNLESSTVIRVGYQADEFRYAAWAGP